MFSSLDRIDIITTGAYVQTDHRTADEIEREPELSVLFAIVRVLNPTRVEPADSAKPVVYVAQNQPPEFLRHAIRAAGGRLAIDAGEDPQSAPEEGETPPLEVIIGSAFAGLARRVA